jgi:hypothetical protein
MLTLRAVALLAAGSAAVHQLRYAIGYGPAADHELAVHGHGYLAVALPLAIAVAVLVLAAVLIRLAGGGGGARPSSGPRGSGGDARMGSGSSFLPLWLGSAIALAAIYGLQESIEGAGAIASGGWIGLALAIPAGLLVALAIRGADAADATHSRSRPALHFTTFFEAAPGRGPHIGSGRIGSSGQAARAPPLASVV